MTKAGPWIILLLPLFLHANDPPGPDAAPPQPPIVVSPDADGIFDVARAWREESADPIPNPFRVRGLPPAPIRELILAVTSVLIPPSPADASAIINGRPRSPGEALDGMTITAIAGDAIDLNTGHFHLRLPVQDRPSRVRLP
jgi:hypothetical protein